MITESTVYLPIPELQLLLVALLAALVLGLAARVITRLLERTARPVLFLRELVGKIKRPVHVLLPLLALQTVWTSAPDDMWAIAGLRHVTALAIIAGFTWLGLRAVSAIQQSILLLNPAEVADNLRARRIHTQTRVLVRTLSVLVIVVGSAAMLMTFPGVRQFGTSLLASAGIAGLAVGFAATPVLGNLIAGLQIAITQPIRLDDVVIVEGEWGRIDEITGTYVVVRIWDNRRLIVPLQWFIEHPFENWTRQSAELLAPVVLWVDYSTPLEPLRREMERLCQEASELWDGKVCGLQVTDCSAQAMQIRLLASAADSGRAWELRCFLRENMLSYINCHFPGALPRFRTEMAQAHGNEAGSDPQVRRSAGMNEHQPPA